MTFWSSEVVLSSSDVSALWCLLVVVVECDCLLCLERRSSIEGDEASRLSALILLKPSFVAALILGVPRPMAFCTLRETGPTLAGSCGREACEVGDGAEGVGRWAGEG